MGDYGRWPAGGKERCWFVAIIQDEENVATEPVQDDSPRLDRMRSAVAAIRGAKGPKSLKGLRSAIASVEVAVLSAFTRQRHRYERLPESATPATFRLTKGGDNVRA